MQRVIVTSPDGKERKGSLISTFHKGLFERATVKLDEGTVVEVSLKKVKEDFSPDPIFLAIIASLTTVVGIGFFYFLVRIFLSLMEWSFKG